MLRLALLVIALVAPACVIEDEQHHVIGWTNTSLRCTEASLQLRYSTHLGKPFDGLPCQASVDITWTDSDPPVGVDVTTYNVRPCDGLFCSPSELIREPVGSGRAPIDLDEPSTDLVVRGTPGAL